MSLKGSLGSQIASSLAMDTTRLAAATREFWCGLRIREKKERYKTKIENSETSDPHANKMAHPGGFGEAASASHRGVKAQAKSHDPYRSCKR